MTLPSVLIIDTESNPNTKQPECITWRYNGKHGIINQFTQDSYDMLKELWDGAEAVLFFNAPYDLGVLSICYPQNSYEWKVKKMKNDDKSAAYRLVLFGNIYEVRRIAFFRNVIKPFNRAGTKKGQKGNKSTPIVDLLKLWSILVDDGETTGGIGLKALIKSELGLEAIAYTPEVALTDNYRYQDVDCLERLVYKFFKHIEAVEEVKNFSWADWAYIKTPATFTKLMYEKEYCELREWKKLNDDVNDTLALCLPLEKAYHGGITLSMYRGELKNTGWVDIKGAYSKAIDALNTDQYLKYDILEVAPEDVDLMHPYLCEIMANFVMVTMNHSLKLFYVNEPVKIWIWSFDIAACQNLAKGYKYEILRAYKPIPLLNVPHSLAVTWNRKKDAEKARNGKTTLYQFYKFLSNTSYGIKAQRKPFITSHTNMVIAGMITSRVHLVLSQIIDTLQNDYGYQNVYNDTDSSCFAYQPGTFTEGCVDAINARIAPFEVEFEGLYHTTKVLSLKRYVSLCDNSKKDKIKLHGRGRYDVTGAEIMAFTMYKHCVDRGIKVKQLSANTERSMNQILKIFPFLEQYKHPFMFVRDVPTDKTLSEFLTEWYTHIDSKTTFEAKDGQFSRSYHVFDSYTIAQNFFANLKDNSSDAKESAHRDWDNEILEDFSL